MGTGQEQSTAPCCHEASPTQGGPAESARRGSRPGAGLGSWPHRPCPDRRGRSCTVSKAVPSATDGDNISSPGALRGQRGPEETEETEEMSLGPGRQFSSQGSFRKGQFNVFGSDAPF